MKAINRLHKYLDYKDIKPTRFEKEIGLSNGYLGTQKRRSGNLGEEILNQIIDNCLDLDLTWLLTGKGNMLKQSTVEPSNSNIQDLVIADSVGEYGSKGIPFWDLPVSAGKSVVDIVGKKKPDAYMYVPGIGAAENIFPVLGMSMGDEIPDGSYIGVCKMNRWESLNTQRIYMIITRDDRMVKRIEYDEENEDFIWCVSPNYPRFKVYKEDIIEIQRVCVVIAPK